MKHQCLRLFTCALWLLPPLANSQSPSNAPPYSAIYAFGDCLTDTHNAEPVPFYSWNGRYSNGPMWIEQACTNLGLIYRAVNNYAVSASTTTNVLARVKSFYIGSLSNALFVIWVGPVDFYWHLGEGVWGVALAFPTNDAVWNSVIAQGVNNISNAVVSLYGKGARSFLVPNMDDVSRQPVVVTWINAGTRTGIQQRVKQFNAALAHALANLDQAYPDLRIVSPDAFGLIGDFIDDSPKYGMTMSYPAAMQDDGLSNTNFAGPGADYVFWDQYGHPTSKGHGFIAANFVNALTNARLEKLSVDIGVSSAGLNMSKLLIGRTYTVQTSSDLANWQDAYPFIASAGTNQILLAWQTTKGSFFRLVWKQ